MANFQVRDGYGSVITIQSSTFGTAERQIVGASIIGTFPVTVSGNPSVSGTVNIGNVPSVNATVVGNPSVSGTVGASIIGAVNINPASVLVLNPVSILAVTQNGAWSASLVGTIPGSVVSFQGGAWTPSVSGTVGASIIGTVPVVQSGTWQPSSLGYLTRNDAVASFLGADLVTRPVMGDSAGRFVVKPFAPEQARIEGTIAITHTSITTVIPAAGAGLKNYITDFIIANSGSVTTLVTFKDGAGSVLGYTIAPATGGSNAPGIATPIRTGVNATFDIQATNPTSTLYGTFTGFKAP